MIPGRRTLAVGGAATLLAAAVLFIPLPPRAPPSARARASQFFKQGLDRELELDYTGAYRFFRRSLAADSSYLPAITAILAAFSSATPAFVFSFLDSLASRQSDPGFGECVKALTTYMRGYASAPRERAGLSADARDCEEFRLEWTWPGPGTPPRSDATAALQAHHSEVPEVARHYLDATRAAHRWEELLRRSRELARDGHHALIRAPALAHESRALHELARDHEARALEAGVLKDPAWRFPGFRLRYLQQLTDHQAIVEESPWPPGDPRVAHASQVIAEAQSGRLAEVLHGDALMRVEEGTAIASWLLNRGRLDESARIWKSLAAVADSIGDPAIQANTRMRLGRTLVKLGRSGEAERELLAARNLERQVDVPITNKEVEHNLLHLYESVARFEDARRAGERFIQFASLGGLHGVRMMSERDFGMLLRRQGEIDESRVHFRRMLADIDALGFEFYFAGEYYELTGELDPARRYYERAVKVSEQSSRALEGLVRIALAIGDAESALRNAQLHDERKDAAGVPESSLLVPGVLASLGRVGEARAAFYVARASLASHGQVASWASLTLELATLELDHGRPAHARALSDSAGDAARRVAAPDVALRAAGVSAVASVRQGASWTSVSGALRTAVRDGERTGYPQLRAELRRLEADAREASGDWRGALVAYAGAASLTDSIAANIALDPQQAGFRSAQRRVYDAALKAIVRHAGEPDAAARFAEWSNRRKSRAFGGVGANSGPLGPLRIEHGRALLDYVVLDSAVAALVVTESGATIRPLPVPADSLRALIRAVREAMDARVGSAIDVSRVRFPVPLAHELYLQLLAPVEPLLHGARLLTIVPDGPLYLVPFDALVVVPSSPNSAHPVDDAVYVLDQYTTDIAVSLKERGQDWRVPRGAVVTVSPAAGEPTASEFDREVAAIVRGMPGNSHIALAGPGATESAVRHWAPRASIVHFAAHSIANGQDPASSRLLLSADSTDDGILYATEIGRMHFAGSLVVLSACETATGRVLAGEGVLSLSRSFLRAGARATIATLWPVGPRTADFMAELYAALGRGASPSAALRGAKLSLRRRGLPPFVWAPYTLLTRGSQTMGGQ